MNDNDYKSMYRKAAADGYQGQFQYHANNGAWLPCSNYWPGMIPGRCYRYLSKAELLQQAPKLYDKNSFLAATGGHFPTWIRLINCSDMLLVAGVSDHGLSIHDIGFKSWKSLANENWQWTQYDTLRDYNDLKWNSFTRE